MLLKTVSRFIEGQGLLESGSKVIVALSGGADSVALLHMLISLREEYALDLCAAHFNHGIRGAEADRDEAFVKALCESFAIPLYRDKADVPAIAAVTGESEELCGRNLRYGFLEKVARGLGGAKIATAHHRDDNAETVLWNLTRGTGIGGLCGIPAVRGNIIRPLLCCSREDIELYCQENALSYVTDSTNLSDDYTRNKLRHQVMPVLRELNPSAEENIARTACIMRETEDHLNKISCKELSEAETQYGYSCEELLRLEPIVLKYAVKKVMENTGAPVDFRHITLIIEAMRSGGAVNLGEGYTAVCAQGILRVVADTKQPEDYCEPFAEFIKKHGKRMTLRGGKLYDTDGGMPHIASQGAKINNLLLNQCIPCDIMTPDTVVRYRREGDTFTDTRRGVTKTLKKLMNELKIPRELRDTIPVIANGSTVLWMQGLGTSAQVKADLTRDGEVILIDLI